MDSKEQIHFLNPSLEEAFKYFYIVPEYQREYVWGDTEVEQLLSDIGEAFQTGKQKDYFIGSTVVCPNAESFEFVDGQQRMTTFFILLCVLRKEYDMNGENDSVLRSMIFGMLGLLMQLSNAKKCCISSARKSGLSHKSESFRGEKP